MSFSAAANEPPVYELVDVSTHGIEPQKDTQSSEAKGCYARSKLVSGVLLILLVTVIWVLSSELIQVTSFVSLVLPRVLLFKTCVHVAGMCGCGTQHS